MPKCMGKQFKGKKITPRAIGRVKKGIFYIPNCPDYEPRIDIPVKVRMDEVFTGWNCRNCKNFRPD